MSFLEGGESILNVGNRAGYLAQLLDSGMSGNQALRTLQDAGIGMQRSIGLKMVAEIRGAAARSADVNALASDVLPPDNIIGTWTTSGPDRFAYQVQAFVKDGAGNLTVLHHTVITDSLIDKGTALDVTYSDMETLQDSLGKTVVGAMVTNIYRMGAG